MKAGTNPESRQIEAGHVRDEAMRGGENKWHKREDRADKMGVAEAVRMRTAIVTTPNSASVLEIGCVQVLESVLLHCFVHKANVWELQGCGDATAAAAAAHSHSSSHATCTWSHVRYSLLKSHHCLPEHTCSMLHCLANEDICISWTTYVAAQIRITWYICERNIHYKDYIYT